MSEKQYALIRINSEAKKLFDAIALKYSKKTNGLFEEMCHFYNDNYLNHKNQTQKEPLNLEEALLNLRKGALSFLNTLEQIHSLVKNETSQTKETKSLKENKDPLKTILNQFLTLMKNTSTLEKEKPSQTTIRALEKLIEGI